MLVKLYEENTNSKTVQQITECLLDGGVIIYPTDTLYAFGCDISKAKAIERMAKIKNIDITKNTFSIVCRDLSQLSDFAKPITNHNFKIIKRCTPGPFTFILDASAKVPKHIFRKKKQIGIRIPDNKITSLILENLGNPIISTSVPMNFEEIEYCTNPELIYEEYKNKIDILVDCGFSGAEQSSVINLSDDEIEIIRIGKGDINMIY